MEIDSTKTALGGIAAPTPKTGPSLVNEDMGRDDFLTLLTAQISNQDPLNPQENHEFVAQLAQFSALEQQVTSNQNLQTLAMMQQSMANGQLSSFIGKEVVSNGNLVSITNGTPQSIQVNLANSAAEVNITIRDENGQTVDVIHANQVSAGVRDFQWDGRSSDGSELPDGRYSISVEATDSAGDPIIVDPMSKGIVEGVTFENGYPELIVGTARLLPSDIISIHEPLTTDQSSTTTQTKNRSNYSAWNR